ncbi:MAG: SprT-like domain-containing protein [Bacteroidia bacterium]
MTEEQFSNIMRKYMPEAGLSPAFRLFYEHSCQFKISRARKSKYGDFRPSFRGQPHRISVNHNLNPFLFLITYIHEYAHLATWKLHGQKAKPHGTEWKEQFKVLMQPFFQAEVFPQDVTRQLQAYMLNPAAASCTDVKLHRLLRNYDGAIKRLPTLEELPGSCHFEWHDGRIFQKKEKLRKRYRCMEVETKRLYLFSPLAEVKLLDF